MKTSKVGVGEAGVADGFRGTRDELDDTLGKTSLVEDIEDDLGRKDGHGRGLPQNSVAEHGGHSGQVAGNSSEVEGADGKNEAIKRSVFSAVPDTLGVCRRLDGVDLFDVLDAETEEVDQFSSSVNFWIKTKRNVS